VSGCVVCGPVVAAVAGIFHFLWWWEKQKDVADRWSSLDFDLISRLILLYRFLCEWHWLDLSPAGNEWLREKKEKERGVAKISMERSKSREEVDVTESMELFSFFVFAAAIKSSR
jgi:hypothetical protein